jgi:CRP/FNR family transcriptional regulator
VSAKKSISGALWRQRISIWGFGPYCCIATSREIWLNGTVFLGIISVVNSVYSQLVEKLHVDCENCSLGGICIPRGLDTLELERVSKIIHKQKLFHKGDYLYRAGDKFESLLALKAGTVKIISSDNRGNDHVVGLFLPGEILGFGGFATGKHEYSAVVQETASVCEIPANGLEALCREVPSLQHQLFELMSCKLNQERCNLVMSKRPAEERMASFLVDLSDRYHRRGFSAVEFNLSLTRLEIGNHLGLALETVSRLLSHLQEAGYIEINRKQVVIKNLKGLRGIFTADVDTDINAKKSA